MGVCCRSQTHQKKMIEIEAKEVVLSFVSSPFKRIKLFAK